MNKVILMGRLTKDPVIRYGGDNTAIATFSLAVDRRFGRQEEQTADFFNCSAFGRQAEFAEKYLHQGTKILLAGRIQNDVYTNREGQRVFSVQIIAEELEFAESKAASESYQNSGTGNNRVKRQEPPVYTPSAAGDGFMNIPDGADEELPFN